MATDQLLYLRLRNQFPLPPSPNRRRVPFPLLIIIPLTLLSRHQPLLFLSLALLQPIHLLYAIQLSLTVPLRSLLPPLAWLPSISNETPPLLLSLPPPLTLLTPHTLPMPPRPLAPPPDSLVRLPKSQSTPIHHEGHEGRREGVVAFLQVAMPPSILPLEEGELPRAVESLSFPLLVVAEGSPLLVVE